MERDFAATSAKTVGLAKDSSATLTSLVQNNERPSA